MDKKRQDLLVEANQLSLYWFLFKCIEYWVIKEISEPHVQAVTNDLDDSEGYIFSMWIHDAIDCGRS